MTNTKLIKQLDETLVKLKEMRDVMEALQADMEEMNAEIERILDEN